MALRRSLIRIDKASLLETFSSLKIRNFRYTPSCLQLLRKSISNFSLFFLYSQICVSLQHVLKELSISENFIFKQLSTIEFYVLKKSIKSHNKKFLKKSLYTQHRKLSSLTRGCNLPIFAAHETVNKLMQYKLSQEEIDLLKAGLFNPTRENSKIRNLHYLQKDSSFFY